jgi:N6-adenosine-specific RNA methylase IME4
MTKYEVIYADCPWTYDFAPTESRSPEEHFECMELENIKGYLIKEGIETEDNSVLYLWATGPLLIEAIEVMKAWGFSYKTCAVWDKLEIGLGYWFRNQHELLLVGTKGKFSPPSVSMLVSSVIRERRREFARKPDAVRFLLGQWYPDKKKIELFSRHHFMGWKVMGNEAPNDIQMTLEEVV